MMIADLDGRSWRDRVMWQQVRVAVERYEAHGDLMGEVLGIVCHCG